LQLCSLHFFAEEPGNSIILEWGRACVCCTKTITRSSWKSVQQNQVGNTSWQLITIKLTIVSVVHEHEERFQWSEVRRGLFSLQVWFTAPAYFAILSGLYSFSLFVSTLSHV
jgi:hypothetical protein